MNCNEKYIGKSARTFCKRFKECLKAPSLIYGHQNTTDHSATLANFSIVGREGQSFARTFQEPKYIKINNPTLKRNKSKHNLPHTWDGAVVNTPKLKIKNQ